MFPVHGKQKSIRLASVAVAIGLTFLCSCAAQNSPRLRLPADVTMNKDAGRGGRLVVMLRLESGEELPFLLDTGAPITVFDKSLVPKLGKQLGTMPVSLIGGDQHKSGIYKAPKLYLGNVPLMTGNVVAAYDFKKQPMGYLGMDCLKHYCIQLDFEAGEMRFLDPDKANPATLGKAFPLTFSGAGPQGKYIRPIIHHDNLIGKGTNLLIDTGCTIDGLVATGVIKGLAAVLPECIWDGVPYTNLIVAAVDHANVLGLSFLARHLVTFNFPKRMMYLKKTSSGSLAGDIWMEVGNGPKRTSLEFLEDLKEKNQLPGLSKEDQGTVYFEAYSDSGLKSEGFGFQKHGDLSLYHYTVTRASKDNPWKLQKAWRTDANGHMNEEFSVP